MLFSPFMPDRGKGLNTHINYSFTKREILKSPASNRNSTGSQGVRVNCWVGSSAPPAGSPARGQGLGSRFWGTTVSEDGGWSPIKVTPPHITAPVIKHYRAMSIREKFTDIPKMHISFCIMIKPSTAANSLHRQKNHMKSVLRECFQRPQDRNSFLGPREQLLTELRLSLDPSNCNMLLGTLFMWPLPHSVVQAELAEPYSLICSRGFTPKVSTSAASAAPVLSVG